LNYTDTGQSPKATVSAEANFETTVVAEYGLLPFLALADQNTTPTQPVTFAYAFTNEGNASDTFEVTCAVVFAGPGDFTGAGWTVEVLSNGVSIPGLKFAGPASPKTVITLESEDGSLLYTVRVTPCNDQLLSPNGANCTVTFSVTTERTPAGQYTGGNGNSYGGLSSTSDATVTWIRTGVMKLTKSVTVDAPATGGFSGDKHAAVPGSIITYTILVSNEGSASAESVIVVDKVPQPGVNTEGCHIGMTPTTVVHGVTITAGGPSVTASDWQAYYTTTGGPPPFTYGTGNGSTWIPTTEGSTIAANTLYVKWEKATVEATGAGNTAIFTWGVTIK
jgi:uncharacterized repeat protein (TIGR01451 family)